jgi:hypothetical protein
MMNAWTRFVRYASEPRFLTGARVFRIIAGVTLLYQLLAVYAQRGYLYGPDGVYPFDVFVANTDEGAGFSLYAWSSAPLYFELLYHATLVVAALWALGWRTRVLTPILWALNWSLHARNPVLWDGGDNVVQLALIYAMAMDLSGGRTKQPGPVASMFHNAGVLACALQICLVYGIAGLTKVQGETWQNGTALYYALRGGEFTWPGYSEWIFENGTLLTLLAYGTVAFQISFPFLLFLGRPRLRLLILAVGLSFHLGIMSFMALVSFGAFMMAVDLMFVTDAEYATARRFAGRVADAIARRASGVARMVRARRLGDAALQREGEAR